MNELLIITHKQQRILTTSQISEAYETTTDVISKNFNRNKDRYVEGKHFHCLEGEAKREFLNHGQFDDGLKKATKLYLWTEKGAFLHAKSLNTDKAWKVYEDLVDTYFKVKEPLQELSPQLQLLINMELEQKKMQQQLNQVSHHALEATTTATEAKAEVQAIRDAVVLDPAAWRTQTTSLVVKIAQKLGGNEHIQDVRKESYQALEATAKAQLSIRLTNMRRKVLEETGSTSKANKITKLDIIAADARLKEIYVGIISKMAIKYGVA